MKDNSESQTDKYVRILVGLLFMFFGLSFVITGEAQEFNTPILGDAEIYHGYFARFYGAFITFCGLCAIFNWTQFGDSGDL